VLTVNYFEKGTVDGSIIDQDYCKSIDEFEDEEESTGLA